MKIWKVGKWFDTASMWFVDIRRDLSKVLRILEDYASSLEVARRLSEIEEKKKNAEWKILVIGLDKSGRSEHRYMDSCADLSRFFGIRYKEALDYFERSHKGEVIYIDDFFIVVWVQVWGQPHNIKKFRLT